MADLTLKALATLLQIHGPGATIQSDHQGIEALLNDLRGPIAGEQTPLVTDVAFRRGGFVRGGSYRKGAGAVSGGAFRKGGFAKAAGFRRV